MPILPDTMTDYSDYDCDQLRPASKKSQVLYDNHFEQQDAVYKRDRRFFRAAIIAGVMLGPFWGFLGFGVKGDVPEVYDGFQKAKGEHTAIQAAMTEKGC